MIDTNVNRQHVVDVARSWLRTPYHTNGRIKGVGVDCGTFLAEVFTEAGVIPYVEIDSYSADWHLHRSEEKYLAYVQRFAVEIEEPEVGDIAAWRFGRTFSHGAIYIGAGQVIHAVLGVGVTIGELNSEEFANRPRKVFTMFGDHA